MRSGSGCHELLSDSLETQAFVEGSSGGPAIAPNGFDTALQEAGNAKLGQGRSDPLLTDRRKGDNPLQLEDPDVDPTFRSSGEKRNYPDQFLAAAQIRERSEMD